MSGEPGTQPKMSITDGLSPAGAITLIVIGIVLIPWGFVNPFLFLLPIFGILFVIWGIVSSISYFKITRMPDGLACQTGFKTRFYNFEDIRHVLFDFKPKSVSHSYINGMYTGSKVHATVIIILIMLDRDVPIGASSSIRFNKDRVAPDPKSLEAKIMELRDHWMKVLAPPPDFNYNREIGGLL